jgi:hypothetical protein
MANQQITFRKGSVFAFGKEIIYSDRINSLCKETKTFVEGVSFAYVFIVLPRIRALRALAS